MQYFNIYIQRFNMQQIFELKQHLYKIIHMIPRYLKILILILIIYIIYFYY